MKKNLFYLLILISNIQFTKAQETDPYLWLEEVEGKKAIELVE